MKKRKKPLDQEKIAEARKCLRKLAGPEPSKTLRAKLHPDGIWRIKPYEKLARFEIVVDPSQREVSGFTVLGLGARTARVEQLYGPCNQAITDESVILFVNRLASAYQNEIVNKAREITTPTVLV